MALQTGELEEEPSEFVDGRVVGWLSVVAKLPSIVALLNVTTAISFR